MCRRVLAILALLIAGDATAAPPFVGHGGPVKDLRVEGERLISAGFDYSVVVWDAERGTVLQRLMGHRGPVNAVATVPERGLLVSTGDDGRLGIWDAATGRRRVLAEGHAAKAVAVAATSDGTLAATAGWDGRVLLWRLPAGEPLRAFGEPPRRYTGVVFGEGGLLVAADAGGGLTAWRRDDGVVVWRVEGNGFPVTRLLRRDGRLYLASIDGSVRVHRLADGAELARLTGDQRAVSSLAVDAGGRRLATGSATGSVYIWDGEAGRVVRVLEVAGGQVWALAFTPDGRRLYVGSGDGAIRVFDAGDGEQIAGPTDTWVTETDRIALATDAPPLFAQCRLCHALTPDGENKSGPTFYGLLGRRVGTLEGYPYSDALKRADVVWTEETLYELFAIGPDRYLPGTKMPIQRIEDREAVRALVAWLARVTTERRAAVPAPAEDSAR